MPSLGPAEILVILVIALLVFGPDKMPDMARQAGRAFREFRRVQQHLRSEISGAMSDGDTPGTAAPDDAASEVPPGGDPVPMLPPKDTPDVRQPDAQPPPRGVTGSAPSVAPEPDAATSGPTTPVPPVPPASPA
jgi:sec-independent protein translocase protein TatA